MCDGSRPRGHRSSTPGSPPGTDCPAPSPEAPGSPGGDGRSCGFAAWRAGWAARKSNPVYAARHRHLTTREQNRLTATQAQTVIAAAILRQLHAVIRTGRAWDPHIATHGTRHRKTPTELAA